MTYFARHLVDALTTPLVVALLLSIGAGVLWIRGRRRMAGALLACASVGVYLFSLVPLGDAMLGPLEHQYHSIGVRTALPSVRYVVVLGSSYAPRADVSAVAAQDCEGLVRIVEALRVIRRLPGARLVLSGGAAPGRVSPARGYAEVARDLGIDERSLIVLDTPLNTEAEARAIVAAIGMQPFLLVTSAWHMPRAMRMMGRVGAQAIPLPTGQQTGASCVSHWTCFLPSSAGLGKTERAIHEYVGLAAVALKLE